MLLTNHYSLFVNRYSTFNFSIVFFSSCFVCCIEQNRCIFEKNQTNLNSQNFFKVFHSFTYRFFVKKLLNGQALKNYFIINHLISITGLVMCYLLFFFIYLLLLTNHYSSFVNRYSIFNI